MTELLKPAPGPIELSVSSLDPAAAINAAIAAQVPPLITTAIAAIPANIAIISSPSASLGAATFVIARRLLDVAEMRSAADVTVINAQAGKVLMPVFAWVHIVVGAVAFSSGRTFALCWTAGGNPVFGSIVQAGPNVNNWRSCSVAEAASGTNAQAVGQALVIRSTSAVITLGDATCSAELFCGVMVITP